MTIRYWCCEHCTRNDMGQCVWMLQTGRNEHTAPCLEAGCDER